MGEHMLDVVKRLNERGDMPTLRESGPPDSLSSLVSAAERRFFTVLGEQLPGAARYTGGWRPTGPAHVADTPDLLQANVHVELEDGREALVELSCDRPVGTAMDVVLYVAGQRRSASFHFDRSASPAKTAVEAVDELRRAVDRQGV